MSPADLATGAQTNNSDHERPMTNDWGFTTPRADELPRCRFSPCVGPRYAEGAFDGLRLLVLGESHYEWRDMPSQERTLTQFVVDGNMSATPGRFVRGVTSALEGGSAHSTQEERLRLWQTLAFYNYSQEFAGDHARERPTQAHWEAAQTPFRQVLTFLTPDVVLVCGKMLWSHVRRIEGLSDEPHVNPLDEKERSRVARGSARATVLGMMAHPSSIGFKASDWAPRVRAYFARARSLSLQSP